MNRNDSIATATPVALLPLPYAENALIPVISGTTVGIHHGKHQRGYVETLQRLTEGTTFAHMPLERIIAESAGRADHVAVFNNAAQAWNHTFYWRSLRPKGGGDPPFALRERIEAGFGSVEACTQALQEAALAQFGSGWAWLVLDGDDLKVEKSGNADTPLARGAVPLLALDVWEHAYYLDYQNRRADYVKAVLEKLVNWGFAEDNLGLALDLRAQADQD